MLGQIVVDQHKGVRKYKPTYSMCPGGKKKKSTPPLCYFQGDPG